MNGPTIHPPVVITYDVALGAGAVVWQFTTILTGTKIGDGSVIGSGCWVGRGCRIGAGVHLNHGCFIPHGTVIEDGVFFGPNVTLTDDRYPVAGNAKYRADPPVIRAGASIGAGAVILPGVTIGRRAMIAAGAVISRDVPDGELFRGEPAVSRGTSRTFAPETAAMERFGA